MSVFTVAHSVSENQSDLFGAFTTDQLDFELARRRAFPPTLIRHVPECVSRGMGQLRTAETGTRWHRQRTIRIATGGNGNSPSRAASTNCSGRVALSHCRDREPRH
jgi:hypothetical protein